MPHVGTIRLHTTELPARDDGSIGFSIMVPVIEDPRTLQSAQSHVTFAARATCEACISKRHTDA